MVVVDRLRLLNFREVKSLYILLDVERNTEHLFNILS